MFDFVKMKVDRTSAVFTIHGEGVDLEPRDILEIDENTGEITVHGPVDFEKHKSLKVRLKIHCRCDILECITMRCKVIVWHDLAFALQLIFQAIDRIKNVVDTQRVIDIQIIDANDHSPEFVREIYEVTVKESTLQGIQCFQCCYEPQMLLFACDFESPACFCKFCSQGCLKMGKNKKYPLFDRRRTDYGSGSRCWQQSK